MDIKLKLPSDPKEMLRSLTAIEWKLPKHPRDIAIAAAAGLVLIISLCWLIASMHTPRASNPEYFTIDDGRTYFTLSGVHFPPFEYRGHEAVEAYLFKGSDGKPFVGCLMKYSPQAQQALTNAANGQGATNDAAASPLGDTDQLFKYPGEKDWLPSSDPKAPSIWGTVPDPKTQAQVPRWPGA